MDISLRELSANFHVPKELIILERTLLLLMGLCTELDPTLNPMTVIRPYLERFVVGDDGDLSLLLMQASKDLVVNVAALPGRLLRKLVRDGARAASMRAQASSNLEASSRLM
jgi:ubiquinone biosynthesis protein